VQAEHDRILRSVADQFMRNFRCDTHTRDDVHQHLRVAFMLGSLSGYDGTAALRWKAKRLALDWFRGQESFAELPDDFGGATDPDHVEQQLRAGRVQAAVATLCDALPELGMLLRHQDGEPVTAIAKDFGLSPAQVKARVRQAHELIRDEFSARLGIWG